MRDNPALIYAIGDYLLSKRLDVDPVTSDGIDRSSLRTFGSYQRIIRKKGSVIIKEITRLMAEMAREQLQVAQARVKAREIVRILKLYT